MHRGAQNNSNKLRPMDGISWETDFNFTFSVPYSFLQWATDRFEMTSKKEFFIWRFKKIVLAFFTRHVLAKAQIGQPNLDIHQYSYYERLNALNKCVKGSLCMAFKVNR